MRNKRQNKPSREEIIKYRRIKREIYDSMNESLGLKMLASHVENLLGIKP